MGDARAGVPGAGRTQLAGHRVVDGVQTRRTGDRRVSVRCLGLVGQAEDEVVDVGEQFVGRQVQIGEGLYGRTQSTHAGGRVDAVPHDIADHQGDPGAGEGMTSNQSPPTPASAGRYR